MIGVNARLIPQSQGPYLYRDLASLVGYGPARVDGVDTFVKDTRLLGSRWVPAWVKDWTLVQGVDAATFNTTTLPAGWVKSASANGVLSIVDGAIDQCSPSAEANSCDLVYTISGLGATDEICVLWEGLKVPETGGYTHQYNNIQFWDVRKDANKKQIFYQTYDASGAYFLNASGVATNKGGPFPDWQTYEFLMKPGSTLADVSRCRVYDGASSKAGGEVNGTQWSATALATTVYLSCRSNGVGTGDARMRTRWMAIYKRTP